MVLYKRHIKAMLFSAQKRHGLGTKGKVQQIVHSADMVGPDIFHFATAGSFLITLVCRCYGMPISVLALLWAGVGCLPGWRFGGVFREVPEWQRPECECELYRWCQVQSSFCVLVFQYWVAWCGTFFYGRFEKNSIANSSNLWCLSLFLFNMYSQSVFTCLVEMIYVRLKVVCIWVIRERVGLGLFMCTSRHQAYFQHNDIYRLHVCVPIYT